LLSWATTSDIEEQLESGKVPLMLLAIFPVSGERTMEGLFEQENVLDH
jgi:hypothetical protein